jgi:hypothetical protein
LVRRDTGTKRWLESGEAWVDGRRGHYIRQYLTDAQSGWRPDEQSTGKLAADLSEL